MYPAADVVINKPAFESGWYAVNVEARKSASSGDVAISILPHAHAKSINVPDDGLVWRISRAILRLKEQVTSVFLRRVKTSGTLNEVYLHTRFNVNVS